MFRLEGGLCIWPAHQPSQRFPWRGVPPVDEPFSSVCIRNSFRLSAGSMKVQVGIESTLIEPVDLPGMRRGNIAIAHVLADHRSVLRLHQPVVIALARPRFGLSDQQFSEQ